MRPALALAAMVLACGGSRSAPRGVSIEQLRHDVQGTEPEFALADNLVVKFRRTAIDRRGADLSWFGASRDSGLAVISSRGGSAFGTAIVDGRLYRLMRARDGQLRFAELEPMVRPLHPARRPALGVRPDAAPPGGPIKVMVAYTDRAAERCQPIEARVKNAIDLTNAISKRSGVTVTFELASHHRKGFDEHRYDPIHLLKLFAGHGDYVLEDLHEKRDALDADVAVLVIASKTPFSGVSVQTMATRDTAFAVVDCDAAIDTLTMAHELGHLLGLNDDSDDPTQAPYEYGYGHFVDAEVGTQRFRTVMTNPQSCARCPLVPQWSNPDVKYPDASGQPSGTVDHDSVRVLRETAGTVSTFLPRPPP